jgi:ABC-type sugar transport system substrate-binding protein
MKKVLLVMFAAAMMFSMFACAPAAETPAADPASQEPAAEQPAAVDSPAAEEPAGDDQITIGYAVKTLSDPYMQILLSGVEEQVAQYPNVTLEVADGQMDVNAALSQVEDFITKKVDVLLFCPQDAEASAPAVEAAKAAGIPVVEVCTETTAGTADAFVGSNDVDAGKMLGEYVMEKLPDGGKILVVEGIMGQSSQVDRLEGLKQTILADSKYELLDIQTANWQRAEAMALTEDWLVKFKEIDAIICENDDMAMGVLEACESAGRREGIIILGVDAIEDAIEAVADGRLDCTILQNGNQQGKSAIDVCVKLAKGETVEPRSLIPFEYITFDNVKDYQ